MGFEPVAFAQVPVVEERCWRIEVGVLAVGADGFADGGVGVGARMFQCQLDIAECGSTGEGVRLGAAVLFEDWVRDRDPASVGVMIGDFGDERVFVGQREGAFGLVRVVRVVPELGVDDLFVRAVFVVRVGRGLAGVDRPVPVVGIWQVVGHTCGRRW